MAKNELTLDGFLLDLRKEFGPTSVMVFGEAEFPPVEVIPTGSIVLDEALGVGGFPRGRVIEIYGPESSGKTSVALHAVGNAQRAGLTAAFIDAEHAYDPDWAAKLGVDTDKVVFSQPDFGEQALQIADKMAGSGLFGIIVIDSVAALVPKAELDGEIGDSHIGLQARMMSQALRMITGKASATKTTVVFINQLREKVGVFFGNPETQPGGKALKFYASVRLDVRRIDTLKVSGDPVGNRVRVRVVKNKVNPPFGVAEFDFMFGVGIDRVRELIDLAVERGVLRKAGSHYITDPAKLDTGEPVNIGNGKDNARQYLIDNPDLLAELEAAVRANPVKQKLSGRRSGGDPTVASQDLPENPAPAGRTEAGVTGAGAAPWDK